MSDLCPTCRRPITHTAIAPRQRELRRRIAALERDILSVQLGQLSPILARQTAAPSCTICSQAAPGKPGQPTPKADLVRPLQNEVRALEQELDRLAGGPTGI